MLLQQNVLNVGARQALTWQEEKVPRSPSPLDCWVPTTQRPPSGFRLWHLKGRSALGVTRRNGLRYSDAITVERFVPVSCDCSCPQTVAELMQVSFAS